MPLLLHASTPPGLSLHSTLLAPPSNHNVAFFGATPPCAVDSWLGAAGLCLAELSLGPAPLSLGTRRQGGEARASPRLRPPRFAIGSCEMGRRVAQSFSSSCCSLVFIDYLCFSVFSELPALGPSCPQGTFPCCFSGGTTLVRPEPL